MYWGRHDDLLVRSYRSDGSLRYELRQRNYGWPEPTNIIMSIEDKRTREEARHDWELTRSLKVPKKPAVRSLYLKGIPRGWAGLFSVTFLMVPGIQRMTASLGSHTTQEASYGSRTAKIEVGGDDGTSLGLHTRNREIGALAASQAASTRFTKRHVDDDTLVFESEFTGLGEQMIYEAGAYQDEELLCRHVFARPIYPDSRLEVSFFLTTV